ncbi:MAG: hypothetical protein ACRD1A_04225, partial [Terriglobales bacterium]
MTAKIAKPNTLGARLAPMFGKSVFGGAIERVRSVQNVLSQRLLESAFTAHIENEAVDPNAFMHSPLAFGRAVATHVFDHSEQIYNRLDAVAGHQMIVAPADAIAPSKLLDSQTLLERLGNYMQGDTDFDAQHVTLRQAMQVRRTLSRFAAHSASDADAMLAGVRMRALDQAIQTGLDGFDATAGGQDALRRVGLPSASIAYKQSTSLWHDGSAVERVVDKIGASQDLATEAIGQGANPQTVPWDFGRLERTLNDPANARDLQAVFRTNSRTRQFKQMVNLAATDGGQTFNRLASGVGSLFLGNYPLYRGVWTLSSLNPHAFGSVAAMV